MTAAQIIIIVIYIISSLVLLIVTNRRSYYAGIKIGHLLVIETMKNTVKLCDGECSKCGAEVEIFLDQLNDIRWYHCNNCNTISSEKLSNYKDNS